MPTDPKPFPEDYLYSLSRPSAPPPKKRRWWIAVSAAALLLLLIWGLLTDWSGSILSAIPKDEIRIFPWNTKGGAL